ncbi:MAG: ABC transporter ATP-binding protein [Actinobacteria bacterium]|nr:ABC transporter ATP-binding protein [Actinomycetota bacterium]
MEAATAGRISTGVELHGVSKTFRNGRRAVQVLKDIQFTAEPGEFVSVIGPSGCGKSTLFKLVAGLERADTGTTEIGGKPVDPADNPVAYMPQKDLLLPWRSVIRNVTMPLEIGGVGKSEAMERARKLFPVFGLEGFEDAYPFTLSGGMRQRAALMRTVIQERPLMLLDEPFGALDSLTRTEMQEFLLDIWDRFGHTIVFITHDIRESIYLSDTIYVMTARPARVRMKVSVDLPRPRNIDVITTPRFTELEAELLHALREENRQQEATF